MPAFSYIFRAIKWTPYFYHFSVSIAEAACLELLWSLLPAWPMDTLMMALSYEADLEVEGDKAALYPSSHMVLA